MATTVMARSLGVSRGVDRLLDVAGQGGGSAVQPYCHKVRTAQEDLAKLHQQDPKDPKDVTLISRLGDGIDKLRRNVIDLTKALKESDPATWDSLSREAHKVLADIEALERMIDLFDPAEEAELYKTLLWMAERGAAWHLDCLIQERNEFLGDVREMVVFVIGRMSEKVDPNRELRTFFDLDEEEFAHTVSADWESMLPASLHEHTPSKSLRLIKDRLEGLVEKDEINRWLHAPNARLEGNTPIAAIKGGRAFQVLQLLIKVDESIPG